MDIMITFFMTLVMMAGIALTLRRPLLWYFKINDHLKNQQEIISLLKELKAERSKPHEAYNKKFKGNNKQNSRQASQEDKPKQ